jgi:hypothetical protein
MAGFEVITEDVGLNMDGSPWVPTVDIKNRDRLLQNLERAGGSAIDRRTTRHAGYAIRPTKAEAH